MDESGFAIGDVEASERIINVNIRQRFQAKPGRQEWVTAVECNVLAFVSVQSMENGRRHWKILEDSGRLP